MLDAWAAFCMRHEWLVQVEEHGETHTFKRMLLKKCYDNFMNEAEEDEPELLEGEEQQEAEERFNAAKKRSVCVAGT